MDTGHCRSRCQKQISSHVMDTAHGQVKEEETVMSDKLWKRDGYLWLTSTVSNMDIDWIRHKELR